MTLHCNAFDARYQVMLLPSPFPLGMLSPLAATDWAAALLLLFLHHCLLWSLLPSVMLLPQFVVSRKCPWCQLAADVLSQLVGTVPQLCCHQACVIMLEWQLPCLSSEVVVFAVDSSCHQSWNYHCVGGSHYHHCCRPSSHWHHWYFFIKVIRWNSADVAHWHAVNAVFILADTQQL